MIPGLITVILSLLIHWTVAFPMSSAELNAAHEADHPQYFVAVEWADPSVCGEDYCWLEVTRTDNGLFVEWTGHPRPRPGSSQR